MMSWPSTRRFRRRAQADWLLAACSRHSSWARLCEQALQRLLEPSRSQYEVVAPRDARAGVPMKHCSSVRSEHRSTCFEYAQMLTGSAVLCRHLPARQQLHQSSQMCLLSCAPHRPPQRAQTLQLCQHLPRNLPRSRQHQGITPLLQARSCACPPGGAQQALPRTPRSVRGKACPCK